MRRFMLRRYGPLALTVVVTLAVAGLLGRWLLGFRYERPTAESAHIDQRYQEYNALLERHTSLGGVDYASMRSDALLEQVYGYFAAAGPTQRPGDFPDARAALAYDINAYNLLVRVAIARAWPVESPLQIRGALEPTSGFGFFQAQRFGLDGGRISLAELDARIRANPAFDPRVPLVMACGGRSCPYVLAPAFEGDELDTQLDARIAALLERPSNLRVDYDNEVVRVMPMILLYEDELRGWLGARSPSQTLEAWLSVLSPPTRELGVRFEEGYTLEAAPPVWDVDVLR